MTASCKLQNEGWILILKIPSDILMESINPGIRPIPFVKTFFVLTPGEKDRLAYFL